jgi:hypothetical protein
MAVVRRLVLLALSAALSACCRRTEPLLSLVIRPLR